MNEEYVRMCVVYVVYRRDTDVRRVLPAAV